MMVALIPPADLLYAVAEEELHMIIPEGLRVSEMYRDFYQMVGLNRSSTIMLDNGAFEDEGAKSASDFSTLKNMIYKYNVGIFCLPDVMGNRSMTIDSAKNFLLQWEIQ